MTLYVTETDGDWYLWGVSDYDCDCDLRKVTDDDWDFGELTETAVYLGKVTAGDCWWLLVTGT